jgi:HK97 family phage major capsid protein
MAMNIEELEAHIGELRSRITSLDEEYKNQALPADAQKEWDRAEEEREKSEELLGELRFRQDRVAALAGKEENRDIPIEERGTFQTRRPSAVMGEERYDLSTIRGDASGPGEMARELRDRGLREIECMTPAHPGASKEDVQAHLERMQATLDGKEGAFSRHMLVTNSPAYRRAFVKGISGRGLSEAEQRALDLTGETGGFLLPFTLDPTVIPTSSGVTNPIRAMADVKQTTTDTWKGVTSGGMTAAYREAEGKETTDDSPKFAQPEIVCHAADAFAQWTYEFGQDYGSIAPEIAKMVQKAKDKLEATKFLSGTGEKEPFGLATGATELVETITKEAFAVGDVYALEQAVPDEFRAEAQWLGHRAQYNRIRQFDTAGGASLFVDNLRGGLGGNTVTGNIAQRLLDYPTNALSTMESGLTKLKTILFFGDFSYYVIADRIGTIAKPIDNIPGAEGRPTGQAGLYFWWRNGAKVMSKTAFRGLKVKE